MYKILVSEWECESLNWLALRGYFPQEMADCIWRSIATYQDAENCLDRKRPWNVGIPEHVAWSLLELRENDPDAYLACLGGDMLEKVLKLEGEIV